MSRLTRHQKKQFRLKITVYIVLLLATLAILAVYGLRTIVSGTIYISSLFSSAKTEDVIKEESFFGRITLEEPPEATSEASIELRGSATDFEKITVYLNDTEAAEITLPKDSQQFTKTIDGLEPGTNTIYAEAFNSEKKEKRTSDTYTVSYLADAPSLTVTAPSESTETVGSADYTITGSTDKNAEVKVNNLPAVVDTEGSFSRLIRLKEGENKITVTAKNAAGVTTEITRTVSYRRDE